MSSIDERIVQMKFDNTLFEKNVATTIGSLEKLKTALDFSGATDSLSRIEQNINKADFSKLASNIQSLSDRFSNWGIVGMTVIQDLTRAAENLGLKMYNATVGQIKSGGWSRATNIDKAKFAIEGLNQSWYELSKSIDKAVTDTRFGFDEAATAASQLVASNVAVGDEMDNALKSIANVASQTGDEYSSIAHIYTTIAGNGKMMTEQLNMFSYRGLNVASMMANVWGKTEAEVREMATKGEISFKMFSDAMNEALGEGAKRANETFEGSMANMKAALSRIGQPFAASIRAYAPSVFNTLKDQIKAVKTALEPLEKKFDDFTSKLSNLLTNVIKNVDMSFVNKLVEGAVSVFDTIDKIMKKISPFWTPLKKDVEEVAGAIENAGNKVNNFANSMLAKKDQLLSVPTSAWKGMEKLVKETEVSTKKLSIFAGSMLSKKNAITSIPTSAWDAMKKVHDKAEKTVIEATATSEHIDEMAKRVISGEFGNGQARFDALEKAGENWKVVQNRVNEMVGCSYRYEVAENAITASVEKATDAEDANVNAVKKRKTAIDAVTDMLSALGEKFREFIETIDKNYAVEKVATIINGVKDGLYVVIRMFSVFLNAALKPTLNFLGAIAHAILDSWAAISELASGFREIVDTTDILIRLEGSLNFIFGMLSNVGQNIVGLFGEIAEVVGEVVLRLNGFTLIYTIVDLVMSVSEKINEVVNDIRTSMDKAAIAEKASAFVNGLINGLSFIIRLFSVVINAAIKPLAAFLVTIGGVILDCAAAVGEWLTNLKQLAEESGFFETLESALNVVFGVLSKIGQSLSKVFGEVFQGIMAVVGRATELFFKSFGKLRDTINAFKETEAFKNLSEAVGKLKDKIIELKTKAFDTIKKVFKSTKKDLPTGPFQGLLNVLVKIANVATKFLNWLVSKINVDKLIKSVFTGIRNIKTLLGSIASVVSGAVTVAFKTISNVIKGFVGSAVDLKGQLGEFWGKFKESEAFKKIETGFDTVKEKASETAGKVKNFLYDAFHNDETGEFEFPKITWEGVKQTWFNIWDWIKEKFFAAKAWIEEKISNITGKEFRFPEINLDPLKEKLDGVKTWLIERFTNEETGEFEFPIDLDGIKEKFEGFKTWLAGLFTDDETGELGISWEGIKKGFDDVVAWIQEKAGSIKTAVGSLFGGEEKTSGTEDSISAFDRIKQGFGDVISWLQEKVPIMQELLGGLTGINSHKDGKESAATLGDLLDIVKKIAETLLVVQGFKASYGVLESLFQFGGMLKEVKGTIKEAKDVVKSVNSYIKSMTKETKANSNEKNARAILEIAGAIALVALAFVKLSSLSWDQVAVGAACIGVITLALVALFGVINLLGKNKESTTQLNGWQTVVSNVLGSITGMFKDIGKSLNKIAIAAIIGALVYAVTNIINVIKELMGYSWNDVKTSIGIVSIVIGELVLAILALNKLDTSGFGSKIGTAVEFLAFAESVKSICSAIIDISEIPSEQLAPASLVVESVMAVMAICVGLVDYLGDDSIWQKVGTAIEFVTFAEAVSTVCDSIVTLAGYSPDELTPATLVVDSVMVVMSACIGLVDLISNNSIWEKLGTAGEFVAFAYGVKLIAEALASISDVPIDQLDAARNALSLVIGAVAAMVGSLALVSESVDDNATGIGAIALSLVVIIATVAEIAHAFLSLKDVDGALLETIGNSLSKVALAIAALMYVINTIVKSGAGLDLASVGTVLGEAGLAALITAIAGVIASLIGMIPGAKEWMNGGAEILEAFGAWIGKFFGGVLGGFLDALGDQLFGDAFAGLMEFPTKLGEFIDKLNPVLDKISGMDSSGATELLKIIGLIAACFGAELLGSFTDWLLGKDSLESFAERLETFGKAIAVYSAIVDGRVNESAVTASANAGKVLAALEGDIENTGGVLSWIVGDNKIDDFGKRLLTFGRCMRRFCGIVDGHINESAITSAANAGDILNTLESKLSNEGGVIKDFFLGKSDLASFGLRLSEFGGHIVNFSDLITGNNSNGFDNAAVENAITTLGKLLDFVERIEGTDESGESKFSGLAIDIINMGTITEQLKTAYEQLGLIFNNADIMVQSGLDENVKTAGEIIADSLLSGMTTKLGELDEGKQTPILKAMLSALSTAFGNTRLLNSANNHGKTVGKKLVEGLQSILSDEGEDTFPSFVEEVVKSFQDMIYRILTTMTNSAPTFKTRAENWMKSLKNGIDTYRASIISWLMNIPSTVLSNYGLRNSEFYNAGLAWMDSLYNGINIGSVGVYELANSVAENVSGIINGAVSKASSAPFAPLAEFAPIDFSRRSAPMLNAMSTMANTGLRTANALAEAVEIESSTGEMAFQQLQSVAGIQNGAFSLSRDAGAIADMAAQSMSRTVSLARSASINKPITNQVYVKDGDDTLEALNGVRRDIKVLTENMANMQMVLDSGVLVGQLTPGLDVSLSQRSKFRGRWT